MWLSPLYNGKQGPIDSGLSREAKPRLACRGANVIDSTATLNQVI